MKLQIVGKEGTATKKLVAGKRSRTHSPKEGMPLYGEKDRHLKVEIHDYSNVYGWNKKG